MIGNVREWADKRVRPDPRRSTPAFRVMGATWRLGEGDFSTTTSPGVELPPAEHQTLTSAFALARSLSRLTIVTVVQSHTTEEARRAQTAGLIPQNSCVLAKLSSEGNSFMNFMSPTAGYLLLLAFGAIMNS